MSDTAYLIYHINLTDLKEVTRLQGVVDKSSVQGAVLMSPAAAAIKYAAPIQIPPFEFTAPSITSEWFKTGSSFPTDQADFERCTGGWFGVCFLFGNKTHYYWRGIFVYSPPLAPTVNGVPAAPKNISTRLWIDGGELPFKGDVDPAQNAPAWNARTGSRSTDGYGLAIRGQAAGLRTHTVLENIPAQTTDKTWERFYLRTRVLGDQILVWKALSSFSTEWRLYLTVSGGLAVYVTNTIGTERLLGAVLTTLTLDTWYRLDILHACGTPGGLTPALPVLTVVINGVTAFTVTLASTDNVATVGTTHLSSSINATAAAKFAFDIDDWIGCLWDGTPQTGVDFLNGSKVVLIRPTADGVSRAGWTGDFRSALMQAPSAGVDNLVSTTSGARLAFKTDWAAVLSEANSLGVAALQPAVWTEGASTPGKLGFSLSGVDTFLANITQVAGPEWNHALYNIGARPTPLLLTDFEVYHVKATNVTQSKVGALVCLAELIGCFGPEDLPPDTRLTTTPRTIDPPIPLHNAPYPRTPWARLSPTGPVSPVAVVSGTYVGNDTGQDLVFPTPVHFLRIRPVGTTNPGTWWWSSQVGSHNGGTDSIIDDLIPQACVDGTFVQAAETQTQMERRRIWEAKWQTQGRAPTAADYTYWLALFAADGGAVVAGVLIDYWWQKLLGKDATGVDIPANGPYAVPPTPLLPLVANAGTDVQQTQYLVRLSGANVNSNANGVTYTYVAFCDPGMRFALMSALKSHQGAFDVVTKLVSPKFTPVAGFVLPEQHLGAPTLNLRYKGPGHAAASSSILNGAELAATLSFGLGTVTSQSALHTILPSACQIAVALFRTDDLSGDLGIPRVVQIKSYTGDNAATRSINLTPASGRRPLAALVVPHNAAAIWRDAQHAGTTSSTVSGADNAATGILAGDIDSITVGIVLNAAGVVYDVFVFPGDSVAGLGGFSPAGTFYPVAPAVPVDGPWPANPAVPAIIPDPPPSPFDPNAPVPGVPVVGIPDPLAQTGPMPGLTDDLDATCTADTHRAINVALSRLGVAVQVANVATDTTAEATAARLVYPDAVAATLRDFPWPFATRYAQLTVVATTPNSDWAFAYRQPTDCLFERRLVVSRGPALDPTPPAFQLSSDTTGGLIFTNQPNAVLEYTARPKCPVTRSEPLFREALGWRLAVALAPALTRMTDLAVAAQKMYEEALVLARQVLRPGNPGVRPVVGTVDVSAAAQAANLVVVNRALLRIGATTIASLFTDQSEGSQAAQLIFEDELRATLRDHPWAFATAYADPLVLVAGAPGTPVNKDWTYAYRVPADLVFARRLVSPSGRSYEGSIAQGGFMSGIPLPAYPLGQPQPWTFRLGRDATGPLLFTNQATPALEYTARPEGAVLVADALFRDAFAWRLAAMLAPSLSQMVPETPDQVGRGPDPDPQAPKQARGTGVQLRQQAAAAAWKMYRLQLVKAMVADANEQQQEPDGNADWINAR